LCRRPGVWLLPVAGVSLLWFSLLAVPGWAGEATSKVDPAMGLFAANPLHPGTEAIKSKMTHVLREDFDRPDGKELGQGWTQAAHYGVVNKSLAHHHLRFEIPDGHDIPWGSATLDLKNRAILDRGLRVGDYFELALRRVSAEGGLGVELFDSDQLRLGGDLQGGASALAAWNGATWVPAALDEHGSPVKFDWNAGHVLGVRFDTADGHQAGFSYFLDGHYAGSWLIANTNRTLDRIGVYAQSKTSGATFEFDALKVFTR